MSVRGLRFPSRILALFLTVVLVLPVPASALRSTTPTQSGVDEDLTKALRSDPIENAKSPETSLATAAAGVEAIPNLETIARYKVSPEMALNNVIGIYL